MARTTNATPGIFQTARRAARAASSSSGRSGGKHVEADLSRQVMVLANHGKPQHIFHISSGAPATPTVRGKFPAYRKDVGYNSMGMSTRCTSSAATRPTATTRCRPTPPATAACATRSPNSVFIYKLDRHGDVFYVYG